MVAIAGFSREQILRAVRDMYSEVATAPEKQFHFPTGRAACLFVGYPPEWLDDVPDAALESFAGVGFPFRAAAIQRGDCVLDIGAGSGTDTLVAARLVGPEGKVLALDMTPAMLAKLRNNVALANAHNVEVIEGMAEAIPLPDASVDVITTNGVLNLVPDKQKAFAEMLRVLRPGGRVQIADIMISRPVGESTRGDPKLWAECVVGAAMEDDYLDMLRATGFTDVSVLRRFDYFSGSASPDTRRIAGALGAKAAELSMQRPATAASRLGIWRGRLSPLALGRRAAAHGLIGLLASAAAIAACYGLIAVVGLLGLAGMSLSFNPQIWAAAIAMLAVLAPLGLLLNRGVHGSPAPLILGAAGTLLVIYAMFVHYDWRVEAAGFGTMLGAALWDRHLFRRALGC